MAHAVSIVVLHQDMGTEKNIFLNTMGFCWKFHEQPTTCSSGMHSFGTTDPSVGTYSQKVTTCDLPWSISNKFMDPSSALVFVCILVYPWVIACLVIIRDLSKTTSYTDTQFLECRYLYHTAFCFVTWRHTKRDLNPTRLSLYSNWRFPYYRLRRAVFPLSEIIWME